MECFCWSSLWNVSVGVVCGLLVSFLGSVLIQFVLWLSLIHVLNH